MPSHALRPAPTFPDLDLPPDEGVSAAVAADRVDREPEIAAQTHPESS